MKTVIKKTASKKPMMQKGGVKKPLRKAQTGTATGTPFQQYMKTPGAVASDTVATRKPIEGSSVYYNNQLSKPVSKNPRNQGSLEKAFEKTYGMDVWDRQYDKSTKQQNMSPAQDKEMRRIGSGYKKGGSVKKMQTGGAKEKAQKVVDQRKLENARKYAKMKQDKGLVPAPTKIDKKYDTPQYYKMAKGGSAHPGFKAVQSGIAAKQGVSKQAAGAILASATRKASPKAKAANPRLKRVKG